MDLFLSSVLCFLLSFALKQDKDRCGLPNRSHNRVFIKQGSNRLSPDFISNLKSKADLLIKPIDWDVNFVMVT
jgi:hypothetical protein